MSIARGALDMKYRQVLRKFTGRLAVSENPMSNDPGRPVFNLIEDSRGFE